MHSKLVNDKKLINHVTLSGCGGVNIPPTGGRSKYPAKIPQEFRWG